MVVPSELTGALLKGVSRSFYLSLRLLPEEMRQAAGLAYLLARASDTLADSSGVPCGARLEELERLAEAVWHDRPWSAATAPWLAMVEDDRERRLLGELDRVIEAVSCLSDGEGALVREVVAIIISGQKLDIERFAEARAVAPVALAGDQDLDDYTWRVAGCVGEFWTKLGYQAMGERFSRMPMGALLEKAVAYGKGLQLVNILRDMPRDLEIGRCYLPVKDPLDRAELMMAHQRYLIRATAMVHQGFEYIEYLHSRRARLASVLPVMIADETLELMRGATWECLSARVKVGRMRVYRLLVAAMFQ